MLLNRLIFLSRHVLRLGLGLALDAQVLLAPNAQRLLRLLIF